MRMKPLAIAMYLGALTWCGVASATVAVTNASGTLTADNEFWLYTGNAAGSDLQYVGSGNSWPTAYSFSFNVNPGDYLYVLAHDTGQPHSWQGVFSTPNGTVYTNAVSWVGWNANQLAADANAVTPGVIGSATWGAIGSELPYNSGPWGAVVGNLPDAKWIWTSTPYSGDVTVLFRTADPVSAVPLPAAVALFVPAVGMLGAFRRRRSTFA